MGKVAVMGTLGTGQAREVTEGTRTEIALKL